MTIIIQAFIFSMAFNLLLYALAFVLQTDKLTDISYSLTFIVIATFGLFKSDMTGVHWLTWGLIVLWAVRLGGYLFYRIMRIGQDSRFNEIRENPVSFLGFWVMQGLTCAMVSLPVLGLFSTSIGSLGLVLLFTLLALGGWAIETIADAQKFSFKLQNPNDYMTKGLWGKIRHPNYTGELLFWWSIFFLAFSQGAPLWTLVGPIWISFIIIFFSGIPPLEKKWKEKYMSDPKFQNYWDGSWRLIPGIY